MLLRINYRLQGKMVLRLWFARVSKDFLAWLVHSEITTNKMIFIVSSRQTHESIFEIVLCMFKKVSFLMRIRPHIFQYLIRVSVFTRFLRNVSQFLDIRVSLLRFQSSTKVNVLMVIGFKGWEPGRGYCHVECRLGEKLRKGACPN